MQISPNLHFQVILQVDLRWPLTLICDLWPHEHMKVSILYKKTKFGLNRTSTFQMRPFSHFQSILQLDLKWPLTFVHDLWLHEHMKVHMLYQYNILYQTSTFQMRPFSQFSLSYNLTSDDLWPWYMTFDCMNKWRFTYYIKKTSLVQIGLPLFKWGHFHIFCLSYNLTSDDLWPWYMTSDCMNKWRFTYYIKKPSLVQIGLPLFKWGHFHIFCLSYNLTSDDFWHWYMNFDLNKWGFPCCIYDPTLVEIHQSMLKIRAKMLTLFTTNNNWQQLQGTKWSLCVFPAKAGDTKTPCPTKISLPFLSTLDKFALRCICYLSKNCW